MSWLKEFEKVEGNSSGAYTDDVHRKLVVHTTEGTSIAGAVGAYKKNNSWPHFTVNFVRRTKVQHVDTALASRALRNESGGVQTNRDGVINLEIVAYAATSSAISTSDLKWLGEEVFRPIMTDRGIQRVVTPRGFPSTSHEGYGAKTNFRMSPQEWDNFSGVCGHANVPENSHWDPGAMNVQTILNFAFDSNFVPPPDQPPTATEGVCNVVSVMPVLRQGSTGLQVNFLQSSLNVKSGPNLNVDGNFGPKTLEAVNNWQSIYNLAVDGVVGENTWRTLFEHPKI